MNRYFLQLICFVLSLVLCAGVFTACVKEETNNNSSVVSQLSSASSQAGSSFPTVSSGDSSGETLSQDPASSKPASEELVSSPAESFFSVAKVYGVFSHYFTQMEYTDGSTNDTVHYLFHEPRGESAEPLPLVIFLHGKGDSVSMNDLGTADPMVESLMELQTVDNSYNAYTLVPITPFSYEGDWTFSQVETFKAMLPKIVEQYNIDPKRVYVSGISMGGFMTCRLVSEMPEFFAAAVPLSGSLLIDFPWEVLGTSFRIYHVATDSVVAVTCSQQLYEQLSYHNHPNLKYVEYETGNHISPLYTVFYEDQKEFFGWLFEQQVHPEYNLK